MYIFIEVWILKTVIEKVMKLEYAKKRYPQILRDKSDICDICEKRMAKYVVIENLGFAKMWWYACEECYEKEFGGRKHERRRNKKDN
jgi:hypothetical protein